MANKQCENHCPRCNADYSDLKYEAIEFGDVVYYPVTCNKCSCEFREYLKYSDTEWQD